ncbi:MAG: ankyrin repeat domain-containing protein [Puniceicoccales bacterium]|jgi:hypothetical protein|nr:ankyrin repeat domain-containing protein [Puniceicoccales bacterium]
MDKFIQKKLLGRMNCGLLIVAGSVGNMAYGSQDAAAPPRQLTLRQIMRQTLRAIAGERIPDDPHGDTWYLQAVRMGNLEEVRIYLTNFHLNFDVVDNDGNTDLMLAIRGGEQDEWGPNYRAIFNFLVRRKNRNWDLRNVRGETALLLAIKLGRIEAVDALLQIDMVDPNISDVDNATPLLAAIANTFIPLELNVNMALRLINHPRVNVNQWGTDNKLPLQIAFEADLLPQLSDAICRKSLIDYDKAVRRCAQILMSQLNPGTQGQALYTVHNWLNDPMVSVNDYFHCPINQLSDGIHREIYFLLNGLGIDLSNFPEGLVDRLRTIDNNVRLYDEYRAQQSPENLNRLFSQLQSPDQIIINTNQCWANRFFPLNNPPMRGTVGETICKILNIR